MNIIIIVILAYFTVLVLSGNAISANALTSATDYDAASRTAATSITKAEIEGADVSRLVMRFNAGLDLVNQAESAEFIDCKSYDDCIKKAVDLFDSVTDQSNSLKEQTARITSIQRILEFVVYAPLFAFIASLLSVYCYKEWKSSKIKRLMRMNAGSSEK